MCLICITIFCRTPLILLEFCIVLAFFKKYLSPPLKKLNSVMVESNYSEFLPSFSYYLIASDLKFEKLAHGLLTKHN